MNIILQNLQVTAEIGANNHGINLNIEGERKRKYFNFYRNDKLTIDIQGPVFSYLPAGLGSLAKLFLPYQIDSNCKSIKEKEQNVNCKFELGKNKLSSQTLKKTLDDVIKAGDPYFYIEFIHNYQDTYCVFPTKCSLIKKSLENNGNSNIVYNEDDIPKFKLKSNAYGYCRWFFFAFLYMIAIWTMVLNFEAVDKSIPIKYFSKNRSNASVIDYLPPFPKNKTEAYLLGYCQLYLLFLGVYTEQYLQMENIQSIEEMKAILEKTAQLTKRKSVTGDELKGVQKTIWELEQKKGIVQRVLGFFTFINLIWTISIIGIAITVGPFIYLLLKPLQKFFEALVMNLVKKVIIPTVEFLHNSGAFEWFSYALCLFLILEGIRLNPEYGFYISLTGLALQIPAFFYSTLIHSNKIRSQKNKEALYELITYWALLCWIPLTFHYNSTLLGYITLMLLYGMIGFSFHCFGLCYFIGFQNDDALIRVTLCSFFGLFIFSLLKLAQVPDQYLSPYLSPINVLGSFTMFLGLLILSSKWHDRHHYIKGQALMIIALIVCIFFGFVFGIDGMKNTAIVFLILFLLERYTETHFDNGWNPWFYFFILSILLWRAALYLHTNPQYIVSLFKMFE